MRFLLITLIFSWATSCNKSKEMKQEMGPPIMPDKELSVGVLIRDSVNQTELTALMKPFQLCAKYTTPGTKVFTIAEKKGQLFTFGESVASPDYYLDSDPLPDIDILLVPGSDEDVDQDLSSHALKTFLGSTKRKALYVIAVGNSTFLLAQAGLLETRQCAVSPEEEDSFEEKFPSIRIKPDTDFVHDHVVITGVGDEKAHEPALYLLELLYGKKVVNSVAAELNIKWDLSVIAYTRVD